MPSTGLITCATTAWRPAWKNRSNAVITSPSWTKSIRSSIDEARTPLIISGPAVVNVDNKNYEQFKPAIESLVRAQEKLCHRFLDEAEKLLAKLHPEDGSNPGNPDALEREIGLLLYRVKLGHPKAPGFLKLLENPDNQKMMNKAELELHADQSKKDLYAQRRNCFLRSTRRVTTPT